MALKLRSWLKSKILTLFFYTGLVFTLPAVGQNLVPNPSFEDTVQCPGSFNEIYNAANWYNGMNGLSSPDFLHVCNTINNNVGIPSNAYGFQYANSGSGYSIISTYWNQAPDTSREIIGTQLVSPLNIGTRYFLSLQTNLALKPGETTHATDNLGFLFSTFPYNTSNPAPIANFAHFSSSTVVTDTMNWTRIFGSFVADSAYTHVSIGNFFDSTNTTIVELFGPNVLVQPAMYYIDDVCVSTDSLTCYNFVGIEELTNQNQIKLYPNPANEVVYVESNKPIERIELYNLTGQLLLREEQSYRLNVSNLTDGIYLLKVFSGGRVVSKRLVKQ